MNKQLGVGLCILVICTYVVCAGNFTVQDATGNNLLLIDNNTGNVGIGTVNPTSKFHVLICRVSLVTAHSSPSHHMHLFCWHPIEKPPFIISGHLRR